MGLIKQEWMHKNASPFFFVYSPSCSNLLRRRGVSYQANSSAFISFNKIVQFPSQGGDYWRGQRMMGGGAVGRPAIATQRGCDRRTQ